MRKTIYIVLSLIIAISLVYSARPMITEDAYLYSGFGLETGFDYAHSSGEEGDPDYTLIGISFTPIIGISAVNIIGTVPILYRMPSENWIPDFDESKFGIGDITVGTKIGLLGTKGPLYLAVYPKVKLPTGKEDENLAQYPQVQFGDGKTDVYLTTALSVKVVSLVHLHTSFTYGMLGVAGREDEEDLIHTYQVGAAFEFGIHDKVGLIAEVIGDKTSVEDTGWGFYTNTGVYFALIPLLNIDFSFNKGWTDYSKDYGFNVDVSFGNLPRF
jgi:hypothetical protein